jgi:hypothetical protein
MRLGDLPFQAGNNECLDPHIWRPLVKTQPFRLLKCINDTANCPAFSD